MVKVSLDMLTIVFTHVIVTQIKNQTASFDSIVSAQVVEGSRQV